MVYTFECFYFNSYTGQTFRYLETRTNKHIQNCVKEHIYNQPKTISEATSNAMNKSSI